MRAIISSKELHGAILKALNYNNIKVKIKSGWLSFGKIKVKLCPLETTTYIRNYNAEFDFDMNKWIRVSTLLHEIPEQPIILEIIEGTVYIDCVVKF